MARRHSAASRSGSSGRSSSSGRSAAGGRAGGAPRARADGKVDVSCPQCGAAYRVAEEMLETKIECGDCHRVFFPKTTAGKRVAPPDHSKVYIGFGVGAVVIIALFVVMSQKPKTPPKTDPTPKVVVPQFNPGNHPRTAQLLKWAQAIGTDNQLVLTTHSDLGALATGLGVAGSDGGAVMQALQTSESTKLFRELDPSSAMLDSEAAMTAASGSGVVYVTPKPNDSAYKKNTRGEIGVQFRMDGEQIKVTGFQVRMLPIHEKGYVDPSKVTFVPNKDIARPDMVEITDSGGTRKVQESKPGPVPHWAKATPQQQAMADQVVADVILSADNEAPGHLFGRATLKIRSKEDKMAVVPRVLNAMYERYADVNAHNMELSQLNRALYGWTGFAVNYQVRDSGDAAKDKRERESCIRQWFAFWWSHHERLDEFFDSRENLEEPLEEK